MKLKITLLLLTITFKSFSQETKLIISGNNNYGKEFYVLKSDENIKHGSFLLYAYTDKTRKNINILETGNYVHGKMDGQWDYFYGPIANKNLTLVNNLWKRVMYKNGVKNGTWTSFHLDTIQNDMTSETHKNRKEPDSTVINLGLRDLTLRVSGQFENDVRTGRWTAFDPDGNPIQIYDFNKFKLLFDNSMKDTTQYNETREALFLGGEAEIRRVVLESFNPFTTNRIGRDSTRVISEFIIKSNGTIEELKILKGKATKELKTEIFRIIQSTSGEWLPAVSSGKLIDSRKILAIDVFILNRKWNSVGYAFMVSTLY